MRRPPQIFRRFRRDRSGATAVEFGLVIGPFLALAFGILGIGLYYFTDTVLDQAVRIASRQIMTGQSNSSGGLTVAGLKADICDRTGGVINCSKLTLNIQNADSWASAGTPASCVNASGSVAASNYKDGDKVSLGAGGRERVVVIVACYPWELLVNVPYLGLGNVNGGAAQLIQSVVAFKSEPY